MKNKELVNMEDIECICACSTENGIDVMIEKPSINLTNNLALEMQKACDRVMEDLIHKIKNNNDIDWSKISSVVVSSSYQFSLTKLDITLLAK